MNNIQISVQTRRFTWEQNRPINEYDVRRILQPSITDNRGNDLSQYARIDLSRIDPTFPGLYHGSININDPHTNNSNFLNFDVEVLPASQADNQSQQRAPKRNQKYLSKNKKWLIIIGVILVILLGITACHHHSQQANQQQQTNQQIAKNTKGIKNNADANAKMQKQLNDLKKAQEDYNNNHDKQAYQDKIAQLQSENDALKEQSENPSITDRLNKFSNALSNAESNPSDDNYQQAQNASGMNGLWNHLEGWFLNWLNS